MAISFIGLIVIGLIVIGMLIGLVIAGWFAFSRSSNEKKDE